MRYSASYLLLNTAVSCILDLYIFPVILTVLTLCLNRVMFKKKLPARLVTSTARETLPSA